MRPRSAGVLMSASTTWPVVTIRPAPAPATNRAMMNSGKLDAQAHHRLASPETTPPSASVGLRPNRSASCPEGKATRKRARP